MAILDFTDRDRSLHFRKLCQRGFYAAIPATHHLAGRKSIDPQELAHDPQIAFNYDIERSFKEWAGGSLSEESIASPKSACNAFILSYTNIPFFIHHSD